MGVYFEEVLDRIKDATGARTQVELANILDIRQSSISDAKRRNSIPADWYIKLFRSHGLNPDWLSDGTEPMYLKPEFAQTGAKGGAPKKTYVAPNKSQSRSQVVHFSNMTGQTGDDGSWHPDFIGQLAIAESYYVPSLLVVQVDGSGMEPIVRNNSFVGIDTNRKNIRSGEMFAFQQPHEGLVLKWVFYDPDNDRFILRSENQDHPDQNVLADKVAKHIVGRVIWTLQKY